MTFFKKNKSRSAFTLIELLVVVSVIGITTTIVLSNWSGNRVAQNLDNSAREVEAVIRETQNAALTGVQVSVGDRPCGFRVAWTGSTYTVTYRYKDAGGTCNQSSQLNSRTLANGVVFNNVSNFEFTLPYGMVSANQTIVLTRQSSYRAICVYTSGRILNVSGSVCP
jgi:prepilin-type N-terminal cleavage/methylation domain-containing protein